MTNPAPQIAPILTFQDVEAAAKRIEGAVVRTPMPYSKQLSELTGADVYIKYENLQFTSAYKERGALNKLLQLDEAARARGVIAASAGNHAQALAYHARRLGIPVTIVMPVATPTIKVMQTEKHGANILLHGTTFEEADAKARALRDEQDLTFVHGFDDAAIMAGQGTVALEMLADVPDLDVLVVPLGGGGLISGVATVAKALKPGIEVIGVESELYPSMYGKIKGEQLATGGDTIAEGIAVKVPGKLTAEVIGQLVDDIVLVPECDLETAVGLYIQIEKSVVEGAGASSLAALLHYPEWFRGRKTGLVVTGGNIDTRLLATVLLRDLARSGRMARLRIELQDKPGALYAVVKLFDQHRVNIVEIYHQRIFTSLPAKDACIDIECEARDVAQIDRLIEDLRQAGFSLHPVEIS